METDIAVQLAKKESDSQVPFVTVIGDDGPSTIKKLREEAGVDKIRRNNNNL